MRQETPDSGWSFVAAHEEAASMLDAIVDLDADETYTQGELSEAAGVPMKTLYLSDTLSAFVDVGILRPVEGADEDAEARYAVATDSALLEAARTFDGAFGARKTGAADD